MIKITTKKLEAIVMENFNKEKVCYLGIMVDKTLRRTKPMKFAFLEWDENDKMKSLVMVQVAHLKLLINNNK